MTRNRIIIPAATIERTKLYLLRAAALLLRVLIFPLAAHASPFDTGISSIQTLFTGTIAKAASLIAIVIGGYTFAHGEPGAKKDACRCRRRNGYSDHGDQHPDLAVGLLAPNSLMFCDPHHLTSDDVSPRGVYAGNYSEAPQPSLQESA